MRDGSEILFSSVSLSDLFDQNLTGTAAYIDEIPEPQFSASTDEEIIDHVLSKARVTPLELHVDNAEMQIKELKIELEGGWEGIARSVPGTEVIVSIPFTGDPVLWKCQPNEYTTSPPRAKINTSRDGESGQIEIILRGMSVNFTEIEIKKEVERTKADIQAYLGRILRDVERHNQALTGYIRKCVAARRQRLGSELPPKNWTGS